jgi:maltose/maltodextrin transport system substrate-binding protein
MAPRRSLAAACAAAVLVPALLAWPAAHAAPLTLLVWINGDKGYTGLQKVGDAFEQLSGVKVVVEHPEDAPPKFQAAAGAGKGPDIFCWAHDRAGEWAKGGLIVPIHPSKAVLADTDEKAFDAFRYHGKLWGYPLGIETIAIIYNKALVKQPPKSWDDVRRIDDELKGQGKHAILWEYNKAFFSWPIFASTGAYVFARDAKGDYDPRRVGINTPGAVRAGELIGDLVKSGRMPKSAVYADMEAAFSRGDVAMQVSGPWAWDNVRKSRIDFGVAPIPGLDGQPGRPFNGVLGCMITAPSKLKDVAREFIENHLLKPENLRIVNADVPLGVPASKAFLAELAADPHIRATAEAARHGEAIPNIPETGRFWTAMDAALEAITNGQQAPKDALDGAAARILVK